MKWDTHPGDGPLSLSEGVSVRVPAGDSVLLEHSKVEDAVVVHDHTVAVAVLKPQVVDVPGDLSAGVPELLRWQRVKVSAGEGAVVQGPVGTWGREGDAGHVHARLDTFLVDGDGLRPRVGAHGPGVAGLPCSGLLKVEDHDARVGIRAVGDVGVSADIKVRLG